MAGQFPLILNPASRATASTDDLEIDSRGAVTFSGAGLSFAGGASLVVTGADDITLMAGAEMDCPGGPVFLSTEDDILVHAPITAGLIAMAAGQDGTGSVTFSADLNGSVVIAAADDVNQNADIAASGAFSVCVTAAAGDITMADGTTTTVVDGALSYSAGGDVLLSLLATTGENNPLIAAVSAGEENNDGSGTITAPVGPVTTAGGTDTIRAFATLEITGEKNDIRVTADRTGADLNGIQVSIIDDGTVADGGAVAVYDADGRILTITIQSGVTTASTVINAVNRAPQALQVTAGGAIIDATDDEGLNLATNGKAILSAGTGIGGTDEGNDVDTDVFDLDAVNDGAGDIVITQAAGRPLLVTQITQKAAAGTGHIFVSTTVDTLILASGQDGVSNAGTGNITISASFVVILAPVTATGGDVTILGTSRVVQNANVNTGGGLLFVNAELGSIEMTGSAESSTEDGNILYSANTDIVVGLLDAAAGTVAIVSETGSVRDKRPDKQSGRGSPGCVVFIPGDPGGCRRRGAGRRRGCPGNVRGRSRGFDRLRRN